MLEVSGLTVRFGGVTALHDATFAVGDGSVCGLIGPNGAGKTTLFNCISRLAEPAAGSIRFDGAELLDKRAHEIAALGIARTFQHLALVPALSVRENVMLGAHHRHRSGFTAAALHLPKVGREERAMRADADEALERVGLRDLARPPRRRARLRPAQADRARAGAVRAAAAADARRARLRAQPRRGRRAGRPAWRPGLT